MALPEFAWTPQGVTGAKHGTTTEGETARRSNTRFLSWGTTARIHHQNLQELLRTWNGNRRIA
eukprot:4912593-Prorocentrum_lima.AAC.1